MNDSSGYLKDITEIRSLMEKSSRFISLSGLSGISAGISALIGAIVAYYYLNLYAYDNYYEGALKSSESYFQYIRFFVLDAILVFVFALISAVYFTTRKAQAGGLKIWDTTAQRMLINLFIPIVAGAIFCLALFYHNVVALIAPASLVFYGLALLNASKYTYNDIRFLGIMEIALGIVGSFITGYGFILWTIGFGVLHIVYGTLMYFKYERK